MSLKILTLNIWYDAGPYSQRLALMRRCIAELNPDVIGLQEVLLRGKTYQTEALLQDFGYHVDWGASFTRKDGSIDGNAVASRWPISDREELPLYHPDHQSVRAALSVNLGTPFGPVSFTVTHLEWKIDAGYIRERQVVEVGDLIARRRQVFPSILVGDMNALPDSTEMRYLRGLHALEGRSFHLWDAWHMAGDHSHPGMTYSSRNPYALEQVRTHLGCVDPTVADRRIDYIYVGVPTRDGLGRVEACRVVCNHAEEGAWPSDHFGVYAELSTEPTSVKPDDAPA